jgi:hypothetical protein
VLPLFQSKATSVISSECAFIDLGLQHAMCLSHISVCGLTGGIIVSSHLLLVIPEVLFPTGWKRQKSIDVCMKLR